MSRIPVSYRQVFEEVEELFRPALRERVDTLIAQLWHDEEFASKIDERFEEGRLAGKFPALTEILSHSSDKEREKFFKVAGMTAMRSLAPPRKQPWDYSSFDENMYYYREALYDGMAFAFHDRLRAFAQEWLEELARVGYYGVRYDGQGTALLDDRFYGLPLKQQASSSSAVGEPLGVHSEAYPVFFENTQQVLWLQLYGRRSPERGYREVAVSDEQLRTDKAIIAALTALEGRHFDIERLHKGLSELKLPLERAMWEQWRVASEDVPLEERLGSSLPEFVENLQRHQPLDYVRLLLRYHRPDFHDLPYEEKLGLIEQTCTHINEFLESVRKLMAFLEYGKPGRVLKARTRDANRDVSATVLRDVDGLTYREIGVELGVPFPKDFDYKGDHPTIRQMVGRGRDILERALGKEGWQMQIQAMKDEAERYLSLSEVEQRAEDLEESLKIPYEEALKYAREEEAQTGDQK